MNPTEIPISDQEFALFQRLIFRIAGISLSDAKKALLVGRLGKRLRLHNLTSYSEYYGLLASGRKDEELQTMVDLLTTNETYFFREPEHFEYLRQLAGAHRGGESFRTWSAASSSGEEAYSIAMTLAETLPDGRWEVVGSDISTRVLGKAVTGHYSLARTDGMPRAYMNKYCLKGVRSQEGNFLIVPTLRQRTSFFQINLMHPVSPDIGDFDVVFLRNVMIYFDMQTKIRVIDNLLPRIKRGGHLIVGHSETLNGVSARVAPVKPTIYRKP